MRLYTQHDSRVTCLAVHPGGVQGKLLRFSPLPESIVRLFERLLYWDVDTAALTVLRPLVEVDVPRGAYLVPIGRVRQPTRQAQNASLATELWVASERLLSEEGFPEVVD